MPLPLAFDLEKSSNMVGARLIKLALAADRYGPAVSQKVLAKSGIFGMVNARPDART